MAIHIRRREFISLLGGTAASWPLATHAQQPTMPVLGFLSGRSATSDAHLVAALQRGLNEAGYVEGQNLAIDFRWAHGQVDHYDAPGNISAEIARLNRIRRANPALQSHLGLRFYNAFNDQVIYYGKSSVTRDAMILVAVNLDPHHAHEATIEVPLWEWGLPDGGSYDLMRDTRFAWSGKLQRIRLDPADLPFAIWRIAPARGG
jgi:starch synthase (maltosyl-transferring)